MPYPQCTAPGDRTFRCPTGRRTFNERTGTPCDHIQYPTALVPLVELWHLRDQPSLRGPAEMSLARGFVLSHEAVRGWETRSAPRITARLRAKRRGQAGAEWPVDEGYVRVAGRWRYRAIARDGNRVEVPLSEERNNSSPKRRTPQGTTPTRAPSVRPSAMRWGNRSRQK